MVLSGFIVQCIGPEELVLRGHDIGVQKDSRCPGIGHSGLVG